MDRLFIFKDGTHKWRHVDGVPEHVTLTDYSTYYPVPTRFTKVQFELSSHMTTCIYVEQGHERWLEYSALHLILKAIFK